MWRQIWRYCQSFKPIEFQAEEGTAVVNYKKDLDYIVKMSDFKFKELDAAISQK